MFVFYNKNPIKFLAPPLYPVNCLTDRLLPVMLPTFVLKFPLQTHTSVTVSQGLCFGQRGLAEKTTCKLLIESREKDE